MVFKKLFTKKIIEIVYDVRFSPLPNEVEGLWGIKFDKNKNFNEHVDYITNRKRDSKRYKVLIDMILNKYQVNNIKAHKLNQSESNNYKSKIKCIIHLII